MFNFLRQDPIMNVIATYKILVPFNRLRENNLNMTGYITIFWRVTGLGSKKSRISDLPKIDLKLYW